MKVDLAYLGHSGMRESGQGRVLAFSPNLARDPVAFDATLRHPLRFREAICSLHDVVVSDLRFQPRDNGAYETWKRARSEQLRALRNAAFKRAKTEILEARGDVPPELETRYHTLVRHYWKARTKYNRWLLKNDYDLWRQLMPCDPVVTVAADVVFFECFSADESSYGCLTVDRGSFGSASGVQSGTTNVDYSWELFGHLQALRSYRETRLQVDPEGFEVKRADREGYREERIDLPDGWLRGFLQVQAAMGLPMRHVSLSRSAVYSLLAHLKRHRAKTSPRSIRFELLPGKSPAMVLEPWEVRIESPETIYEGPGGAPIRTWGRRRLLSLARLLPLAERFDVFLLGSGLPSFWVARMGDMRFTLGLSGWTTNDWTRGSSVDQLGVPADPRAETVERAAAQLRQSGAAAFADIESHCDCGPAQTAAILNRLALTGQCIYDLTDGVYRWRQIMPRALGEAELGPEDPQRAEARVLFRQGAVKLKSREEAPHGAILAQGRVGSSKTELMLDGDGRIKRGKCNCSWHYRFGIRQGPCAHLQAMQRALLESEGADAGSIDDWYRRLAKWATG